MKLDNASFWKRKTIKELAREQGVKPATNLNALIGGARQLWKSDQEFDRFLTGINRTKKAAKV